MPIPARDLFELGRGLALAGDRWRPDDADALILGWLTVVWQEQAPRIAPFRAAKAWTAAERALIARLRGIDPPVPPRIIGAIIGRPSEGVRREASRMRCGQRLGHANDITGFVVTCEL